VSPSVSFTSTNNIDLIYKYIRMITITPSTYRRIIECFVDVVASKEGGSNLNGYCEFQVECRAYSSITISPDTGLDGLVNGLIYI